MPTDLPDLDDLPDIDVPDNVPAQSNASDPMINPMEMDSAVDLPDIEFGQKSSGPQYIVEPDAKEVAIKYGIIGAGQGGSRLAASYYDVGYRRVCAINTTAQDFLGLSIPKEKQLVLEAKGGAGKDPQKGRNALKESQEDVLNLMRHSFGEDIERIIICIGAGGGCIDPNEFILTKSGMKKAKDLLAQVDGQVPNFETETGFGFIPNEDLFVASVNTETGANEWKKIETIWDIHKKPTVLVSTESGSLQCSEDHIFFVYNPTSDCLVEKKAKDLLIEDLVLQYDGSVSFGEDQPKDWMWLLGYFAGKGNFKYRTAAPKTNPHKRLSCVRYDDADFDTLKKAEKISSELHATSTNLSPHKGQTSHVLYVYGENHFNQIRNHYKEVPIPKTGHLGSLPEIVVNANRDSFIAFLAGVVSADGHVRKGRGSIDIAMVDIDFVRELGLLASLHGFTTSFRIKNPTRSNEKPLGRIHIFDMTGDQKKELAKHLLPVQTAILFEHQSMSSNLVQPTFKEIEHLFTERPTPSDYVRGTYQVSKKKFETIYADQLKDSCLYKKIYKNLYPIKRLEKLQSQKFVDFTIEDNHNYFAGTDRLYLVHNSGTGAAIGLYKLAKYYLRQLGKDEKVGMIVTIPKKTEGGRVQGNAYRLLNDLNVLVEEKAVSPFILVDNESIHQMFPNVSAKAFWSTANKNTVGLFDIFNVLACQQSAYVTFDKEDYRSILDSGAIIVGATKLDQYKKNTDISDGLRENIKRTLLAEVDITTASHIAAILCAPDRILDILPQSDIDLAFTTLERIIGGENKDVMVHQGIYEARKMGLYLYTMVGGLKIPKDRLNIMKVRAGIVDEDVLDD